MEVSAKDLRIGFYEVTSAGSSSSVKKNDIVVVSRLDTKFILVNLSNPARGMQDVNNLCGSVRFKPMCRDTHITLMDG